MLGIRNSQFLFGKSAGRRSSRGGSRPLRVESLESRRVLTSLPYGATELDLGEFFLGDVVVTPVFLESNGQNDVSTEDWDQDEIQQVLDNIDEGLQWWVDTLATLTDIHELNFTVDTTYALEPFETRYEGINRRSNDYDLYATEFFDAEGSTSGSLEIKARMFNDAQRQRYAADWSFTIFVVPSFDDADGKFAPGGSFERAFAFAGGLFMVVPSTRPASTFAHETGHIFWARDEYPGAGSYFQRRGYYNTQNLNSHDNPEPGFVQQPSIMASGSLLDIAYANHVSPASTLAMVGWQDSDGDGIFDVLDVPHRLMGAGYYDVEEAVYRFSGRATVQTLPNINSSGLQNDITINRIREIEYRFDNGPWELASAPDAYEVDLELSLGVPPGASTIEIRARDSKTTVTSNVFVGRLERADATPVTGINGFVWIDENENGLRDLGELGPELWLVELLDSTGQALDFRKRVEPDELPTGQLTSDFSTDLTLTANGTGTDGRIGVFGDSLTSTGTKTFRAYVTSQGSYSSDWNAGRRLQADFAESTSLVMIDAIGSADDAIGRLEAFNSAGELVDRYTTGILGFGEVETMVISRDTNDIAYVIASGHANSSVKLDNLRFGPETQTATNELGGFAFPNLPAGDYSVRVTPSSGFVAIDPAGGQQAAFAALGTAVTDVDFGFRATTSPWQNPNNANDVNNDEFVSALDVLLIVNDINRNDTRQLGDGTAPPPPYIDVSGDNFVSALDALIVVNFINSSSGNGEGEFVRGLAANTPQNGSHTQDRALVCSFLGRGLRSQADRSHQIQGDLPSESPPWLSASAAYGERAIFDNADEEDEIVEALALGALTGPLLRVVW